MKKYGPPLLLLIFLGLFFELLVQQGLIPSYLLPAPTHVFQTAWELRQDLSTAFLSTLAMSFAGLLISSVLGFVLSLLLSSSQILKRAFLPLAIFFQTVPIVSVAPLMVIWFGFGQPTVLASAIVVSFFPILANGLTGLASVNPELVEVFKLYRASPWQILLQLRIPSSLPYFFAGLRVSAGLAVIGAIVGEFVGGGGLGSLIDAARTQQRVDIVFAAVILSSLLGIFLIGFINLLSIGLLRFRPYFHQETQI